MKLNLRSKALGLRKKGYSLSDISKKLQISESTASLWCRAINLTDIQLKKMEVRKHGKFVKFMAMVRKQQAVRKKIAIKIISNSKKSIGKLTARDLFIAGVALYWAEGFKHKAEKRVGFCNSDPAMVRFMIDFLKGHFGVKNEEISPRLTLNQSFQDKTDLITNFWADYLRIPTAQFTKPFYQKTVLAKIYEDQKSYHGVLRIHIKKSSKLMLKMRGYLEGIRSATID